jgi:putative ATP-dependent endonuclease of the OLD family
VLIVRLDIQRFRCIRQATLHPEKDNVYLGPNNVGKTAVLEALNLLLSPDLGTRGLIDENDFYCRRYRVQKPVTDGVAGSPQSPGTPDVVEDDDLHVEAAPSPPTIRIEAVLTGIVDDDLHDFSAVLVPWDAKKREVCESTEEGIDPFAGAETAIRVCFEGWYDEEEDDFAWRSYFRTDPQLSRDESVSFTTKHRRRIGFLIYRDFRALQRPVTVEPYLLFGRLLQSQDATPKQFENVLNALEGTIKPLFREAEFARVVNEYRQELQRYLPLATTGGGELSFEATDRTREQVKAAAQLYISDQIALPLQKMGAGTRSLAILAILLLIARKRGRGIIALEEPETFLFPHAQRRVLDEVRALASQTFVTTHSPYVLERMPVESFQRVVRDNAGTVTTTALMADKKTVSFIRERFRRQLSEALLGRGAIVVEEESVRLWILKASALLHGQVEGGKRIEALELQGVAVVSAIGNGDVPTICQLLLRAGLTVVGFVDQLTETQLEDFLQRAHGIPMYFHKHTGLEDLLLEDLPPQLVRQTLTDNPHAKHQYAEAQIIQWTPEQFAAKARTYFMNNKGHQPFHEWILDRVDASSMPAAFKRIVTMADGRCGTCSLLPS